MLVLVADDNASVQYFLKEVVNAAGHQVIEAHDGAEAMERYLRAAPQLILADLNLPGLSGLELLSDIRRQDSEVFFVLMTNVGSEEAARQALELKSNNYLSKPLRFETIVSLLDKFSAVIKSRTLRQEVARKVTRRELTLILENRIDLVSEVAEFLVQEAGETISRADRAGVHLGLYELILNAIEHGNLGINFEEKRRCLAESPYRFTELVTRRLQDPEKSARRVAIEFRMDERRLEWTIQDQGNGFDWNMVPNPLADDGEALNGRGIFLARFQFDEVNYLGSGNRVRVLKAINRPVPTTVGADGAGI